MHPRARMPRRGSLSGALHYVVSRPSGTKVRLREGVAILRYEARIEMEMPTASIEIEFWHTDVYERRYGRWQAVWSQATQIRTA